MPAPTTLRALEGMPETPPPLAASTLVMIDLQNTYTRGVMELEDVQPALDRAAELLDRARSAGTPVIHIMHDGGAGTPYDVHEVIARLVQENGRRLQERRLAPFISAREEVPEQLSRAA